MRTWGDRLPASLSAQYFHPRLIHLFRCLARYPSSGAVKLAYFALAWHHSRFENDYYGRLAHFYTPKSFLSFFVWFAPESFSQEVIWWTLWVSAAALGPMQLDFAFLLQKIIVKIFLKRRRKSSFILNLNLSCSCFCNIGPKIKKSPSHHHQGRTALTRKDN